MRRAASIDSNQPEIVKAARKLGFSVYPTHSVGKGFPDAVMGLGGHNYLCEIKDGDKPPSKRKLTDDEQRFFDSWNGQVCIIEGLDDLLKLHAEATGRVTYCPPMHAAHLSNKYTVNPKAKKERVE